MNFAQLVTFWKMKDMVKSDACLYEKPIYDSDKFHAIMLMDVRDAHNHVAKILYKYNNGKLALINADIMFKGWGGEDDRIWIKNAKLYQLAEYVK